MKTLDELISNLEIAPKRKDIRYVNNQDLLAALHYIRQYRAIVKGVGNIIVKNKEIINAIAEAAENVYREDEENDKDY